MATQKIHMEQGLFQAELEFYNKNREQLLKDHKNRYLLIKGDALIASYLTNDEAIREGVRQFGSEPFLVRESGTDTPSVTIPVLALGIPCQN